MILMYDSTSPNAPPADAPAVAGYIDGFGGFQEMVARHPHAHHLSITVRAGDADCLDWEPGTAQVDVGSWIAGAIARNRFRPCAYADLSDMRGSVLPSIERRFGAIPPPGPGRRYRIWSAHPTGVEHICGPHTCGQLSVDADATQFWFDSIGGPFHGVVNVDVSVCRDDFFGGTTPPPPQPEDIVSIAAADLNGVPHVFVEDKAGNIYYTYQPQNPKTSGPDRAWEGGVAGKQIAGLAFFAPAPK